MSTNKTPNLQLHAWEPTDGFSRAEFNDNFAKLDAVVGEHNAALNTKGNCTIIAKAHLGTGTSGASAPSRAYFQEQTDLVVLADRVTGQWLVLVEGCSTVYNPQAPNSPITTSLYYDQPNRRYVFEWYSDTPEHQFNVKSRSYSVIGFYYAR